MPWAAPVSAGLAAAAASVLAASVEWEIPPAAKIGVTVAAALLVGLTTWATTESRGGAGRARPRSEPGPPAPDQWPPVPEHFTGRTEALAELREVFSARRGSADLSPPLVVSVYGRGGVGKSALMTRFGQEVAGWFPDGRLYADLRGGVDAPVRPDEVLIGFLRALDVRLTTDPGGLEELRKLWLTWTKGRRILIGLDNAHAAEQVKPLIPAEPGCAVLVTSRAPLFLNGTHDTRLGEFSEAHGVELLARLAGGARVVDDLEAAKEVVRLCDYLPLAINICGGRLATREQWTMREMANRLADTRRILDLLEVAPTVDKSVRASVQLSYDDCTGMQRRLLRLLSALTSPDVPGWVAGELLDSSGLDGADQLEALMDAQLAECSGTDQTGTMRYRLHDLVRVFAAELAGQDEEERRRAAIERVLYGYRRRAEEAAQNRWPQDWSRGGRRASAEGQHGAGDWLNAERLSLIAMVHLAHQLRLWELTWGLARAFCSLCHSLRAYWADWVAVAELGCQAAEQSGDRRSLAIALLDAAAVHGGLGLRERGLAESEQALAIFEELGESWWAARAMRTIGMTLFSDGNLDRAQDYLIGAITAFKGEDDLWWMARTQRNLAEMRMAERRPEEARELLEDALEIFKREGNRYSEAQTLRVYGEVLAAQARGEYRDGDRRLAANLFTRAGFSLDRAGEMFKQRGELWEEARCLRAAGEVGDPDNGLRELDHVRRCEEILLALGDSWGVARTAVSAGRALARLGRIEESEQELRRAVHEFAELEDRWWMARSLRYLGEAHLDAGGRGAAVEPLEQARDIYRSLGNEAGMRRTLELLRRAAPST
ncbi:ATP-binding protein [Nonomuraea gerenzanensis]|uniref:Transcriptional regulator, SARP family n=1 Tax=Nonomuraea gerenzanensis TaxID=93944 RepID=A0A1M4EKE8_9ACTN|nr:tetratricopeptide repeat protein [Nonomuraea gerenzanensis]UBU10840.1 tetratricopeptide repeat protein [Nonomuraea gerenzanensis]SBO99274.1 Transcriptional regulator, SARP family [Nonomuraea gerenzanensis]